MKRYSIEYAFVGSRNAETLGFGLTGCWYLGVSVLREDDEWSPVAIAPHTQGEASAVPTIFLLRSFTEHATENGCHPCPYFMEYGYDQYRKELVSTQT